MYLQYFGLNEAPFSITPDPAFVYLSAAHRDALAHLMYGVGQGGSGGFVQLTGEVASYGVLPVIRVAALISLIIGITNLFPIPALDGSRVVFVIIEAIRRGKRLKPQTEGLIHFIGFALLIVLLFIITWQDIMRIVHGQSLLG